MKTTNIKRVFQFSILVTLLTLTACAGAAKKQSSESDEQIVDMTRPPVTITGAENAAAESDPNETVSFEKWKDEREEKKANSKPDE